MPKNVIIHVDKEVLRNDKSTINYKHLSTAGGRD